MAEIDGLFLHAKNEIMSNNIKIEGFKEAQQIMKHLPEKLQRNVLLKLMRKGTKPLIMTARNNAKSISAKLAKSIGNITSKNKKVARILVGPRVKGKYKYMGWFAHFVEYGVSGIVGKKKGGGYKRESDNDNFIPWVGKLKEGERYRTNQPARPFMRPAIDSSKSAVNNKTTGLFQTQVHKETEKLTKKYKIRAVGI